MLLAFKKGPAFATKCAATIQIYIISGTISGENSREVSHFQDSPNIFLRFPLNYTKDKFLRMFSIVSVVQ